MNFISAEITSKNGALTFFPVRPGGYHRKEGKTNQSRSLLVGLKPLAVGFTVLGPTLGSTLCGPLF
jgi:hypothetical protein